MYGACDNVEDILNIADLFVLPSKYEGLPLSILESMSCGIPVIATDVGGIGQAIINGYNGFKVNLNNMKEYKLYIFKLHNNEHLYNDLKSNCRNFVYKEYSIKNCVEKYIKIYDE